MVPPMFTKDKTPQWQRTVCGRYSDTGDSVDTILMLHMHSPGGGTVTLVVHDNNRLQLFLQCAALLSATYVDDFA